jgi:hypothetical protein
LLLSSVVEEALELVMVPVVEEMTLEILMATMVKEVVLETQAATMVPALNQTAQTPQILEPVLITELEAMEQTLPIRMVMMETLTGPATQRQAEMAVIRRTIAVSPLWPNATWWMTLR